MTDSPSRELIALIYCIYMTVICDDFDDFDDCSEFSDNLQVEIVVSEDKKPARLNSRAFRVKKREFPTPGPSPRHKHPWRGRVGLLDLDFGASLFDLLLDLLGLVLADALLDERAQ